MATKPDKMPRWATVDVNNGPLGQPNTLEPSESKKDQGWDFDERPAREYQNWFMRYVSKWLEYNAQTNDEFNQFYFGDS